jgi:hypothetical protein
MYDEYNRTAAELDDEIERNKKAGRPLSKEAQKYLESKTPKANVTQPKPPAGIGALRGTTIPALGITAASSLYGGLTGPDQVNIPTEADVNPGDLTAAEIEAAKRPALIYPRIRNKERYAVDLPVTREQKTKPINTKPAAAATSKPNIITPPGIPDELKNAQIAPQQNKPPAQDLTPKEPPVKEFNVMDYIRERQARADKAAEMDKWQAGLAAGLGMLGGTSPYAFENIGKGGQLGVQQLAQLQKLRATQDIASDKMLGTAYNAELLNKLRKDQLAQGKERADADRDQRLITAKSAELGRRLKLKGITDEMIGMLEQKQTLKTIKPEELAKLNLFKQQMQRIKDDVNREFSSGTSGYSARRIGQ